MNRCNFIFAFLCLLVLPFRTAGQEASSLSFNEVMVANMDQYIDPCWNYGAWVEIYNSSDANKSLRGYWLSDDTTNLKKLRISTNQVVPAKGFLNLWFDNYSKYSLSQINMKLDADGALLILSNSAGVKVASVTYPPAIARSSYARMSDGDGEWAWSPTPTPNASNVGMSFSEERLPTPEVSHESCFFNGSLTIKVTIPEGCELRYTTDGSTPSRTHGQTSKNGIFTITASSVYRFSFIRDGYLNSKVVTRSFLTRTKAYTIPVISIAADPEDLYSDQLGIFVKGTNGRAGRGQSEPCNWNMDWERACNFEFLSPDGTPLLNQETWISRCGGWTRAYIPYSFKIHAVKVFEGKNTLAYPFFSAKPYLKHKMLQIRNGGNDNSCRVKDAFLHQLVATSGLDVDYQEYSPVAHYINGVYCGVINMREPNNKQHVYANYGLDDEEIDMYEIDADSGYLQMCGTNRSWKELYNISRLSALSTYYNKVMQQLDIDAFCNYMAVQLYLGNSDWPKNNLKAFRPKAEGGRFRFILYDLDHSFYTGDPFVLFSTRQNYTFNTLYNEPVSNITQEVEVVSIFLNLLKNLTFRKRFIDTFCLVAGSVFEPERCAEVLNRLADRVADMQVIANSYGTNTSPWGTTNSMISSLHSRPQVMIDALKNYGILNVRDVTPQSISLSSSVPTARITVNDIYIPTGKFNGKLFPPVVLKAEAPAGYRFVGWKKGDNVDGDIIESLVPENAEWKYYDKGSLDGANWTGTNYTEENWDSGSAPLGYGNIHSYATTLDYGGNANAKRLTYYFRHKFNVGDIADDVRFELNYAVDDGMVVYVNGTEAYRYNMPEGSITYSTVSTTYAGNDPLVGKIQLDKSLFRKGRNVIAVEVHNNSQTSSDIHWNMSLLMSSPKQYEEDEEFWSTEPQVEMSCEDDAYAMKACYRKLTEQEGTLLPVVINEVSASNSVYVNDYHKKADWVELYNTTSEDIDLDGYYLSDDMQQPRKWRLSASNEDVSTVIPAHGYRIVWCDKQIGLNQLHANFKLANEDGAAVVLTAPDASWADTLVYCAHDGGETVGRYPDASDSLYRMSRPTIEKTNIKHMYATRWDASDDNNSTDGIFNAHEAGLGLTYADGELLVKSEDPGWVCLTVCSLSGTIAMQTRIQMQEWHERVSVRPLQQGVYVATLVDAQGNRCTIKFSNQ